MHGKNEENETVANSPPQTARGLTTRPRKLQSEVNSRHARSLADIQPHQSQVERKTQQNTQGGQRGALPPRRHRCAAARSTSSTPPPVTSFAPLRPPRKARTEPGRLPSYPLHPTRSQISHLSWLLLKQLLENNFRWPGRQPQHAAQTSSGDAEPGFSCVTNGHEQQPDCRDRTLHLCSCQGRQKKRHSVSRAHSKALGDVGLSLLDSFIKSYWIDVKSSSNNCMHFDSSMFFTAKYRWTVLAD